MDVVPTQEEIQEALKVVIDPELRHNIVDLGMVRSIEPVDGGRVNVVVSLTTPGCPVRSHFSKAIKHAVGDLEGVSEVIVGFDVLSDNEKQTLQGRLKTRHGPLSNGALAA